MTQALSAAGGRRYTTNTRSPRFDLIPGVGQRSCTFRFDLVSNDTDQVLGQLTPLRDSVPVLSHDTTRSIKRQLNLALGRDDSAAVDTIHDRVLISMVLPSGVTYPLGRYMFTDNTRTLYSSGVLASMNLMDEGFILDQPITSAVGNGNVTGRVFNATLFTVREQIHKLCTDVGLDTVFDDCGIFSLGAWPIGTHRAQVIEDLAVQGGYFSPWLSHDGRVHMVLAFEPAQVPPDFDFDANDVVYAGNISLTNDLLTAPNRVVVVSNTPSVGQNPASGTNTQPSTISPVIIGAYDIPASAPHSQQNRGFVIADVRQMSVTSLQQAQLAATTIGIKQTIYERAVVTTPPDPRFDSYDVVRWRGANWLELGWSMQLIEGGTMQHTLRKAYL